MGSFWESVGETIGYGLATVVLGPTAALDRRARRAMRAALIDFCRDLGPVRLAAPRGSLRRVATLPLAGGSLPVEIDLDLAARRVRLSAPIARLPGYVEAQLAKSLPALRDARLRLSTPRATSGAFCIWTESLDTDAATALVDAVATGSLGGIEAVEITLSPEGIDVLAVAPQGAEGWTTIRDGVVELATWLARRWPSSYR